jgi:hypothetical protein
MPEHPAGLGNNFEEAMAEEWWVAVAVVLVAAVVVAVAAVVVVVVVVAAAVVGVVEVVSEAAVDDWAPEVPLNLARGWPFPKAPENAEKFNYLITVRNKLLRLK